MQTDCNYNGTGAKNDSFRKEHVFLLNVLSVIRLLWATSNHHIQMNVYYVKCQILYFNKSEKRCYLQLEFFLSTGRMFVGNGTILKKIEANIAMGSYMHNIDNNIILGRGNMSYNFHFTFVSCLSFFFRI